MGGNRTDKSYFTAPPAPDGSCEAGRQCSSQATQDAGVPVAQVFKPPYFFNGDRPDIKNAPDKISYNDHFEIRVFKKSATIKSVAMIQQHPVTHNHQWNRYVDLWFKEDGGELIVQAPAVPGLAPPGHYIVFVVNEEGVPSVGKHIQLKLPQR
jgi:galactose oxidase